MAEKMDAVRKRFRSQLAKGEYMTNAELKKYARSRNVLASDKQLKKVRREWLASALFTPRRRRPVAYMSTPQIPRLGLVAIDFAYYKKDKAKDNDGFVGFLVGVQLVTGRRHCVPFKDRGTESFERAMEQFLQGNVFPAVTTVLSDRETAVWSVNFRKRMKEKYGLRFYFLQRFSKSAHAERAIRDIKEKLSASLLAKGGNRWLELLQSVQSQYNRQKVEGTKFRRIDVSDDNFAEFISEKRRVEDASMLHNTASTDIRAFDSEEWKSLLFRFRIGQKVLLSKRAFPKTFEKPSEAGGFYPEPFKISGAALKTMRGGNVLIPGKLSASFWSQPWFSPVLVLFQFTRSRAQRTTSPSTAGSTQSSF